MTRATLATTAQQQGTGAGVGGRLFPAGTVGHAEPLHAGDEPGLWRFQAADGAVVLVSRWRLRLHGEKEPPRPSPLSPVRRGWRPWDEPADRERSSLAAILPRELLL